MVAAMDKIDIETIDFQQSDVLEDLILKLGKMLHDTLLSAKRYDEIAALSELVGEFTLLASSYGEGTMSIPEDLGVSLNEAVLLRLAAVKQDADTLDTEWEHYANQTKMLLDRLENRKDP